MAKNTHVKMDTAALKAGLEAEPTPPLTSAGARAGQPASTPADQLVVSAVPPQVRVVTGRAIHSGIPAGIEGDEALEAACGALPANYSFEVKKTVWKVRVAGAKRVALQFPEGLLLYSCVLADILARFTGAETVVLADVTYGACCVDDLSAAALGCDFLVHYGHSCLVPMDLTSPFSSGVRTLYVFVEISFDTSHLASTIASCWPPTARIALMGTIQFVAMLHGVKSALAGSHPHLIVPQSKPLSPGETLGCTAAALCPCPGGGEWDALVFVADGRFHLEAALIANPSVPSYRYDPYGKRMTSEGYDHAGMRADRRVAVEAGAAASRWGLILGTLGRQGSPAVLARLEAAAKAAGKSVFTLCVSEIKPASLKAFGGSVEAWVQVACPRLSIDWGAGFGSIPLLTPYEAHVALGLAPPWWEGEGSPYPMDYYARDAGPWGNYWKPPKSGLNR